MRSTFGAGVTVRFGVVLFGVVAVPRLRERGASFAAGELPRKVGALPVLGVRTGVVRLFTRGVVGLPVVRGP